MSKIKTIFDFSNRQAIQKQRIVFLLLKICEKFFRWLTRCNFSFLQWSQKAVLKMLAILKVTEECFAEREEKCRKIKTIFDFSNRQAIQKQRIVFLLLKICEKFLDDWRGVIFLFFSGQKQKCGFKNACHILKVTEECFAERKKNVEKSKLFLIFRIVRLYKKTKNCFFVAKKFVKNFLDDWRGVIFLFFSGR